MELECAQPAAARRKGSEPATAAAHGASEKMWIMLRRGEMVGWRERGCCALSGGRDEGERDGGGGEGASLRGLELGTDGRSAGRRSTLPFFLRDDESQVKNSSVSQHKESDR